MPSTMSTSPPPSQTTSTFTPTSPLTPESLESDLLAHLASTSALEDLHSTLLCSLQRMGWTEKIRKLSLELLRAGRCERFDEVVDAVVALAEGREHPAVPLENNNHNNNGVGDGEGQHNNHNHNGNGNGNNSDSDANAFFGNVDVRVPSSVVEQGVRAIKEVLGDIVVIEDDGLDSPTTTTAGYGDGEEGDDNTPSKTKKSGSGSDIRGTEHQQTLKNGDTKKMEKKPRPGKNVK